MFDRARQTQDGNNGAHRSDLSKLRSKQRRAQAFDDCRLIVALTLVDSLAWLLLFNPLVVVFLAGCVMHVCVLVTLAWLIHARSESGRDVRHLTLALVLGAMVGAVGMTISAFVAASGLFLRNSRQVIEAWYQRQAASTTSDEITDLIGSIHNGRVASQSMRNADNFSFIIREGTFSQKQAIMEVVARNYRPELLPVLNAALTSTVPAIRVQAAAVKGKLYTSVMTRLRGALDDLDRARTKQDVAEAGRRLSRCILSGLLDPDQKLSALTASKKVHDIAGTLSYGDESRELFHELRHLLAHFDEASALLVRMEEYGGHVDQHRKDLQEAFAGFERGVSSLPGDENEPADPFAGLPARPTDPPPSLSHANGSFGVK